MSGAMHPGSDSFLRAVVPQRDVLSAEPTLVARPARTVPGLAAIWPCMREMPQAHHQRRIALRRLHQGMVRRECGQATIDSLYVGEA